MAVTKVLARDWTVTVGGTAIGGINSITFSSSKTNAETTDFASSGWAEHIVAERTRSMSCEGFFMEDEDTGDRNAGQSAIEALAELFSADSLGTFVLTSPGGTTYTFSASVELADIGGGNNDPTSWGFTAEVSGSVVTA